MPEIPHDEQAEAAFLACVLIDPQVVIPEAARLGVTTGHFHDLRHQTLWHHMQALWDSKGRLDTIILRGALVDAGKLEAVGGDLYLMELPDKAPSAHNWQAYWAVLKEKHYRRKVLEQARKLEKAANDPEVDLAEAASRCSLEVLSMSTEKRGHDEGRKAQIVRAIDYMDAAFQSKGASMGLATGFRSVDRLFNGLRNGGMYVVGARPKVGKTQFCLNVGENVAEGGSPVGVFGLEMGETETNLRTLARYSGVNIQSVLRGEANERDFLKLTQAAAKASGLPLHIRDRAGATISKLRAEARIMVGELGIKLFIIDYLQLIASESKREGRTQEVEAISREIKLMAKELNVPVIVISQLSREVEKEQRMPRPSDLRQSGAIEQDADGVALLHADLTKEDDQRRLPVDFLLALHRHGDTGMAKLVLNKPVNRFEEEARFDPDKGW